MEKLNVGKLVFFKDGKQLELPLSYTNLLNYDSKIKQSLFSKEEAKFLSFQLGFKVNQGDSFNPKFYKKITEQGFSIIRNMPFIKGQDTNSYGNLVTICVSDKVKEADANNLRKYLISLEDNSKDKKLQEQLYVYDKGRYYYYETNIDNSSIKSDESNEMNHNAALDMFLKYKINTLSADEEKLMKKYFKFDMQDVFLSDTINLSVSHKNAAVILISQNGKRYSATKKMEQHKYEAMELIKKISREDVEDAEVDELSKKYNMVIMRIFKTDRNAVVIYCPEKMTIPQIDELVKCMNDFGRINLMLKIESKPDILPLIDGNENLEAGYNESNGVEIIRKKAIEYEKKEKESGLVGVSKKWVTSNVSNIAKYLEKLRQSLVLQENKSLDDR